MATMAALLLATALLVLPAAGLDNGLARTPPMGYNTWNDLQCNVNELQVRRITEKLLELGFRDRGYQFVNIDDCWMAGSRNSEGKLYPQSTFPSGMKAMGDFIHSKGFKFGLYTSRGSGTCVGLAGSLDHEAQDARSFAEWGVDFLKNDGCCDTECFAGNDHATWRCEADNRRSVLGKYGRMRDGLNATGRPVVYEVCGWEPWYAPAGSSLANMFRVGADVQRWPDVYEATQLVHQLGHYSRPGSWAHPDMLLGSTEGAQFRLTPQQSRAQFTLWSVFPAPLILGAHVVGMSEFDRETYLNEEVIAVNQDALVKPARRVFCNCGYYPRIKVAPDGYSHFSALFSEGSKAETNLTEGHPFQSGDGKSEERMQCQQVWVRRLQGGDVAVAAVNFAREGAELMVPLAQLFPHLTVNGQELRARDLWARRDLPADSLARGLRVRMPPNGGHLMLRVAGVPAVGRAKLMREHVSNSNRRGGSSLGSLEPGAAMEVTQF